MSNPAGRKSADTCRTERVAYLNESLIRVYRIGATSDAFQWDKAKEALRDLRALIDGVEVALEDESEARERERRGETVHGEDSEAQGQMSIPGA